MKHGLLITASMSMLLLAACSSSPHHGHESSEKRENPAKAIIQAMDMNGDGQVSWQENQQYFAGLFTRLDVHHDGTVSEEEFKAINNDPLFKAMPLKKLQVSFAMFDRNDDHRLSRDEFEHMGDRIFTLLDRNMDGVISESDFAPEPSGSHDPSEDQSGDKGRHGDGMGGSSNGGF